MEVIGIVTCSRKSWARMVVVEQAGSSCRRSRHGRRSSSVAPQSSSTGMLKQKTECKAKFRKQIKPWR